MKSYECRSCGYSSFYSASALSISLRPLATDREAIREATSRLIIHDFVNIVNFYKRTRI